MPHLRIETLPLGGLGGPCHCNASLAKATPVQSTAMALGRGVQQQQQQQQQPMPAVRRTASSRGVFPKRSFKIAAFSPIVGQKRSYEVYESAFVFCCVCIWGGAALSESGVHLVLPLLWTFKCGA